MNNLLTLLPRFDVSLLRHLEENGYHLSEKSCGIEKLTLSKICIRSVTQTGLDQPVPQFVRLGHVSHCLCWFNSIGNLHMIPCHIGKVLWSDTAYEWDLNTRRASF